ncbi:NADPH-dependent FMN reductase [Nocardioides limicola]|uniref:NADPH-dependent FMN reductase n=1 Tax=Nocardioides limicola TaxID=2803368 RepID=UPI00193C140B|nr:NAD(P)H-dependent oxidoreductase [Nocardioides sp. DJM-14]
MEPTQLPRILIVTASTRPHRLGPAVADWFSGLAETRGGLNVWLADLADADLPAVLGGRPTQGLTRLQRQLDEADGIVVVTPEYNHSFPASLKQAIDLTGAHWRTKPVGFVSYGGRSGGIRATEQLRQVLPELHATSIRENVSIPQVWELVDTDGALVSNKALDEAAHRLLDQLSWWALALRDARATRPYAA